MASAAGSLPEGSGIASHRARMSPAVTTLNAIEAMPDPSPRHDAPIEDGEGQSVGAYCAYCAW